MSDPRERNYEGEGRPFDAEITKRQVVAFIGIILVLTGVTFVGMWQLYGLLEQDLENQDPPAPPLARSQLPPPEPRLQDDPETDLVAWQLGQSKVLHSYGWTDESQSITRIPIERAMERIAHDGLPQWSMPVSGEGDAQSEVGP